PRHSAGSAMSAATAACSACTRSALRRRLRNCRRSLASRWTPWLPPRRRLWGDGRNDFLSRRLNKIRRNRKAAQNRPNWRIAAGAGPARRHPWLALALLGGVVLVAIAGCVLATITLLRPSTPPTFRLHMATDIVPLRKLLAEEIRAEAARHYLDL